MRSSIRRSLAPAVVLVLLAMPLLRAGEAGAAKNQKAERYVHPAFASFQVQSVGILPVATLTPVITRGRENDPIEIVGIHLERALAPTGYRFLAGNLFRSAARAGGADSAFAALVGSWKVSGELDTTALRAVGAAHVADAVLAAMVMVWERNTIDYSVAGQSMTQMGVRFAMYSTRTGELLWRDTLFEKGDGPYNNPGEGNVTGMSRGELTPQAQTSTSLAPPSYDEVATKLEKKIRSGFPARPEGTPKAAPESSKGATPGPIGKFGLMGSDVRAERCGSRPAGAVPAAGPTLAGLSPGFRF